MADLNGIPILGQPKTFTRSASNAVIVDRGMYDLVHFTTAQFAMAAGNMFPKWGEPLTLRRPVGAGMFIETTYLLPENETDDAAAVIEDAATPPANDDGAK